MRLHVHDYKATDVPRMQQQILHRNQLKWCIAKILVELPIVIFNKPIRELIGS